MIAGAYMGSRRSRNNISPPLLLLCLLGKQLVVLCVRVCVWWCFVTQTEKRAIKRDLFIAFFATIVMRKNFNFSDRIPMQLF